MTNVFLSAFHGGLLIGLSAHLNFRLHGRVTGISGMISSALRRDLHSQLFLLGLLVGGLVHTPVPIDLLQVVPFKRVLAAGLLVGAGTRLGSGCTSGHGVCGIARASLRSFVAVIVFMTVAVVTASTFGTAQLFTFKDGTQHGVRYAPATYATVLACLVLTVPSGKRFRTRNMLNVSYLVYFILGWLFATGMCPI